MSNSHQQSLDEEAVFLPVTEACPEFLHSESERLAVERLMSAGPAAFYACLGSEKLGGFLSQEEVNHISGWTQDYTVSRTQVVRPESRGEEEGEEEERNGEDGGSSARCLSSCYFPTHSDAPAPCLDLGWPERNVWPGRDCIQVLTSPPEEGQPSIRESVRRRLQQARQVIAIVTDRLTDNVVIGDLHSAASRGVPVYIILNQRSTQDDYTPSMLRHPHMQVRVLGGKTFCSREGRMVVGQMKDNYILVDLETVIHGSYSLTWTDAHLHRHLVTLLSGPVVGTFDREFRILFAASLPVPEVRAAPLTVGDATHYRMNESSDLWYPNRPLLEPLLSPPPPPPEGTPLDWEALGVFHRKTYPPGSPTDLSVEAREGPTQNSVPCEKQPPVEDAFARNITKCLDTRDKQRDKTTPGENKARDIDSCSKTQFSMTDSGFNSTSAEIPQRVGPKIERVYNRHLVKDSLKDVEDRKMFTNVERRKETTLQHGIGMYLTNQRRDHPRTREAFHEDGHHDKDDMSFRAEKQPSSRKPLILRVPQNDSFSSLSDIMRRLKPQPSASSQQKRGSKMAMSELSRSMMDLSAEPTQERGTAVPRLQFFDPGGMTPAIALMKKRNDEVKTRLYRTPNIYQPTARPRSSTFGMQTDWRQPGDRDAEMKK